MVSIIFSFYFALAGSYRDSTIVLSETYSVGKIAISMSNTTSLKTCPANVKTWSVFTRQNSAVVTVQICLSIKIEESSASLE